MSRRERREIRREFDRLVSRAARAEEFVAHSQELLQEFCALNAEIRPMNMALNSSPSAKALEQIIRNMASLLSRQADVAAALADCLQRANSMKGTK